MKQHEEEDFYNEMNISEDRPEDVETRNDNGVAEAKALLDKQRPVDKEQENVEEEKVDENDLKLKVEVHIVQL